MDVLRSKKARCNVTLQRANFVLLIINLIG